MAIIKYILPTQPTKAIGGFVAYKHGSTISARSRARTILRTGDTKNPNKNIIAVLSVRWELLTNAQRIAWGLYAFNSPLNNAWNMPRYIRGYAHYMRSNRPRVQWGLPVLDDAPTDFGFPPYTLPVLALAADNTSLTIIPTGSDDWANEDGAFMLLWISRPTSPGVQYAPEKYTPLVLIAGQAGSPPGITTVATPGLPFHPIKIWVRSAVTRADGRYTSRQ